MAKVYLETSFFSECVTTRTSAIDLGRRATSLNWWKTWAGAFDLCISPEVVRELSSPDFPARVRTAALAMLRGLEALAFTPDVTALAQVLVHEKAIPAPSVEGDSLHVSFCIIHRVDYLLTWNQRHLANPNKRTHLGVICPRLNLPVPQIVTPDLMIVENDDE